MPDTLSTLDTTTTATLAVVMNPQVSAYFRNLGKKATGDKKRRDPAFYAELSRKGVAARKRKAAEKATTTVADEKKSEV